ncbi:MAG: arylsulfatase [Betaproteobacteria bacterium]|nr:arylsulfatase [Betaproteobacteria bacterium]
MNATAKRPNILLIVVDDMGWSDLGAFGGEIVTPNLDALASRGAKLTNFHTSPLCATTRAMLMTGCDHHQVGLGTMAELITPEQRGKPGYEGFLNDRADTIAERLRKGGYRTMMSGKWHLGIHAESPPSAKGFERSFALFQGEHNHYGADQTDATAGVHGKALYQMDGRPASLPAGAYSTDVFADRMIEFLNESEKDERPFFAYLAFTAPHCPLQAPADLIAANRGKYDDGPEVLRERRMARMRELGLSVAQVRHAGFFGSKPWGELTADERALDARKMEIYAAMVHALDRAVGRVVAALDRLGRLDNTFIMFLSDNGPSGTLRENSPGWREWIAEHAVNRFDNIGRPDSYTSIGPRWAEAQAAPFFLFKRYTTEGGVRTCAFAAGPGVAGGREAAGFIHVTDLAPTLLEFAGIDAAPAPDKLAMRGSSVAGLLAGRSAEVHPPEQEIGWELAYGRALRKGDWKVVYLPSAAKNIAPELPVNRWLLFNLANDTGETTDLSAKEPAKLQELVAAWNAYARETGVVIPAVT